MGPKFAVKGMVVKKFPVGLWEGNSPLGGEEESLWPVGNACLAFG